MAISECMLCKEFNQQELPPTLVLRPRGRAGQHGPVIPVNRHKQLPRTQIIRMKSVWIDVGRERGESVVRFVN